MKYFIAPLIAFSFGLLLICGGKSPAQEMCSNDCLGEARRKMAACAENQACKMDVKAAMESCEAACLKSE